MRRAAVWLVAAVLAAAGVGLSAAAGAAPTERADDDSSLPDPYPVLVQALESGQGRVQAYAAEAFLESGRTAPQGVLVELARSPDPRLRTTVLAVLGTTRRRELVPLFRSHLRDSDPVARLSAAFGMAMAGDASQVETLRDALASPDIRQRRTACWLLGLMGNPSAVGMLKLKLADPDALVALRAAEALGRLDSDLGLEPVRRLTGHGSHEIRAMAARILGRIGRTADIPRLAKLAESKRFLDVKFAAIAALARLGDLKRVGLLVDMLEAPDAPERALAARALAETGYTPALKPLGRLLKAEDILERTSAAAAMLQIQSSPDPWRKRAMKEGQEEE